MYALAAAKRKGSKQAAAELDALTAKMKLDRSALPAQVASPAVAPGQITPQAANLPRRSDRADDKTGRMALGARTPRVSREPRSRASGRDSDWMARALGRPN